MTLRNRLYWSLVVALVVSLAWNEWKPWPESNGLVQAIAQISPQVYHSMRLEWLTRGFMMAFTVMFLGMSGRKRTQVKAQVPTKLPVYAEARDRDEFYFVLGEEVKSSE